MKETEERPEGELTAVILAAGVGSRLRPLTDGMPKCLVPVAGRPVLGWQLEAFQAAGIRRLLVVAGYRAGDVQAFCAGRDGVTVIVNEAYDRTNNMVSLQMALDRAPAAATIICNGDVVFDPAIAAALAASPEPNLIAVEPGRYIEESMKVVADESGRISALSKQIPEAQATGVSIDLYRFSPASLATIRRLADGFIRDGGQTNLWTEVAIEAALPHEIIRVLDIDGRPWVEIDNHDDLAEGERLFAGARA